jgi:hypothetical protein
MILSPSGLLAAREYYRRQKKLDDTKGAIDDR